MAAKAPSALRMLYSKFYFHTSEYKKLGLMFDDLRLETPEVLEAIRRLPQKVKDERTYRIFRASYLTAWHKILPEHEWTKFEEDVRYLTPLEEEVIRENKERAAWDKK